MEEKKVDKGSDKTFIFIFLGLVFCAALVIGGFFLYKKYGDKLNLLPTSSKTSLSSQDKQNKGDNINVEENTIADMISDNERFKYLMDELKDTKLFKELNSKDKKFTVFLPYDVFLENTSLPDDNLEEFAKSHVVADQTLNSEDLLNKSDSTLMNMNGTELKIESRDGRLYVDGVEIIAVDLRANNGVVHVTNSFLVSR